MSQAYRSAYEHILGTKIAEAQAAHDKAAPWLPRLYDIRRDRLKRGLSGLVGILGAAAMVTSACVTDDDTPTTLLLGSVTAMAFAYFVAHVVFWIGAKADRKDHAAFVSPRFTGDLHTDLALVDEAEPLRVADRQLSKVEGIGMDPFLVAVSLLAPLTIHYVVARVFGIHESFANWIKISLVIVGHAHIALAIFAVRFARKLRRMGIEPGWSAFRDQKRFSFHREWGKALGFTVLVTCLPGILAIGIPPLISLATGLAFIPFLFGFIHWKFEEERAAWLAASAHDRTAPAPIRVVFPPTVAGGATAAPYLRVEQPSEPSATQLESDPELEPVPEGHRAAHAG